MDTTPLLPSPRDPDSPISRPCAQIVSLKASACPPRARLDPFSIRPSSLVLAHCPRQPPKRQAPLSRTRPEPRARATWAARFPSFHPLLFPRTPFRQLRAASSRPICPARPLAAIDLRLLIRRLQQLSAAPGTSSRQTSDFRRPPQISTLSLRLGLLLSE